MSDLPLVSCIMPTCDRRFFVPLAIAWYQRQDWPNRELIIIDDGGDPVADLVPGDDPTIRYVRLAEKETVGAKRNRACSLARGEIILHWDDDDWYSPDRVRRQVEFLQRQGADVCGVASLLFYAPGRGKAWRYSYPAGHRPWVAGTTFCYTRAFWERNPFPPVDVGEDARFLWSVGDMKLAAMPADGFVVAMVHERNVSPKRTDGAWYKPVPTAEVERLMGDDLRRYRPAEAQAEVAAAAAAPVRPARPAKPVRPVRQVKTQEYQVESPALLPPGAPVPDLAVARTVHLALPEFRAYNHGQMLPPMRRWELPFALFQARLPSTGAVLDCTINPAGLRERLLALYPDTIYRHWNPLQNDSLALPFGMPDEAFDRVFCINTLEHFPAPQREELLGALVRKLKPGGLLILTCDWYFDSLWAQPDLLRLGVIRADRTEVMGGWNQISLDELRRSCAAHGLTPLLLPGAEPDEADPTLYRSPAPASHATIGAVLQKGPAAPLPAGRKVVLSLLTWNTREVSLESVHAFIREGEMLRRLGHEPVLCVVDNGSTDGTAEALRDLEPQLGLPHRFICNPENRGNSVARNQIIDVMQEVGADYLVFLDGDIEIIPFATMAMLRYMENKGHRLGCVGADFRGQTMQREKASPCLFSVDHLRVEATNVLAWTQFGMFRREIFAAGARFDVTDPFDQPGWGFEDNDLAFQIDQLGFANHCFFGTVYLHRAPQSSIKLMREDGIDPGALYERRRQHMLTKWGPVMHPGDRRLAMLRGVRMP